MTPNQFLVLKNLDEHGQLHLVSEQSREEYLGALRYCEIKSAGIEIKEVNNESTHNNPSHCVLNETRDSGLHPTKWLDDAEKFKRRMGVPPLGARFGSRNPDGFDSDLASKPKLVLVGASRPFGSFLNRWSKK